VYALCSYKIVIFALMNPKFNTSIIGRIGKDAILHPPTPSKQSQILTFDLVTKKSFKNTSDGTMNESMVWVEVRIFFPKNKPVKLTEWCKKGKEVVVVGTISSYGWVDKESQKVKTKLSLTVLPGELVFL
jgi:single-stranded DNA-binding protein